MRTGDDPPGKLNTDPAAILRVCRWCYRILRSASNAPQTARICDSCDHPKGRSITTAL